MQFEEGGGEPKSDKVKVKKLSNFVTMSFKYDVNPRRRGGTLFLTFADRGKGGGSKMVQKMLTPYLNSPLH